MQDEDFCHCCVIIISESLPICCLIFTILFICNRCTRSVFPLKGNPLHFYWHHNHILVLSCDTRINTNYRLRSQRSLNKYTHRKNNCTDCLFSHRFHVQQESVLLRSSHQPSSSNGVFPFSFTLPVMQSPLPHLSFLLSSL